MKNNDDFMRSPLGMPPNIDFSSLKISEETKKALGWTGGSGLIEYQPTGWTPEQIDGLAVMATAWKGKEYSQFSHLFDISPIDSATVRYILLALEERTGDRR